MPTIIIIPVSKASVLKSMPFNAAGCVNMPDTIIKPAPSRAITARLTFSLKIIK